MTEMIPHADNLPERRIGFLPGSGEAERIWKLANAISSTDFVPRSIRGNAPAIMAAMLTGRELGILPMRALRQINVIDGKPSPAPELMAAMALKAGHDVFVAETTSERCLVEIRRADWPEDRVARLEWTLDDAVRAGLCTLDEDGRPRARSRNGAILPWEAYTRAMLRSRAISEACRTWLPDVVEGASYAPEELGADVNDNGHATELIETADARGSDYDPLDGEPDEVRQAVAAAMGDDSDEPQVGEDGTEIVDAEEVDDDDDEEGGEPAPDPDPEPAGPDAGPGVEPTEPDEDVDRQEPSEEPTESDAAEDEPLPGMDRDEAIEIAYNDLTVVDVNALLRNGEVVLDSGVTLELPLPPAPDGYALIDELEDRKARAEGAKRRKTVDTALAAVGWQPGSWQADDAPDPQDDTQDGPGDAESPSEGEDTGEEGSGQQEPSGRVEPDPLPEGDDLDARRALLRRWKAAHRELGQVDEDRARLCLSARLNAGLGPDESWADKPIEDLRRAVTDVERARAQTVPF